MRTCAHTLTHKHISSPLGEPLREPRGLLLAQRAAGKLEIGAAVITHQRHNGSHHLRQLFPAPGAISNGLQQDTNNAFKSAVGDRGLAVAHHR